jgi:hypothetical protein
MPVPAMEYFRRALDELRLQQFGRQGFRGDLRVRLRPPIGRGMITLIPAPHWMRR